MIAFRSLIGTSSRSKPCSSKNCTCKPAGNLVRRLESLHGRVSDVGATLVGGPAVGKPMERTLFAKSTVGSDSVGTEPNAERECGA
jgi:hypothetical protein